MSELTDDTIRASEIGEYVHCHRAWWLGHVEGVENANHAQMDAGTERHREHGERVQGAVRMQYTAVFFFAIAGLAALLLALRLLQVI